MIFPRKAALGLILSVLFLSPFLTVENAQAADDPYEENDTRLTAWHPGYDWERTWLSDINGLANQADDDWYQIDIDSGSSLILVDCRFTHAEGDIDISLYNPSGSFVAGSNTETDNEFISYPTAMGGTFYILVHYGNAGNTYDLWWDDVKEDAYEENDTLETAWHPGYDWERTWLSDINGNGNQADDDWYRIDLDPGTDYVQVDCRFTHADGDIDIALYDSSGALLAVSESITDDEFIDQTVSSSGAYYIKVYKDNAENTYNLWWNDIREDAYEENDTLETAWHPGYGWEGTWLSEIAGLGTQTDADWYRIDVAPGSEQVQVDCQFTHAGGDIDIALYDSFGVLLAVSNSITDDEFIDHTVPSSGTYYILVYCSDVGNSYDLRWGDLSFIITLISDFSSAGLYQYDGSSWCRLTLSDPQHLASSDRKLAGDFGGAGLWEFDGNSWSRLTSSDADNTGNCMVGYGAGLVIDFGGLGLYRYDGSTWSKLTPSDAEYLATYVGRLVGDFGSAGLWEFNGSSWTKLTSANADNTGNCMVTYGPSLVIDFGGLGLYRYDGSAWSRLTHSDAEYLAVYNGKLVGDFGAYGLWEFDGAHWSQLTPTDPDNTGNCMVAYGTSLAIDFGGFGLYRYDGTWSKLTVTDPEHLAVYDNKLVGDFGVHGLWEFDGGSWSRLTSSDADNSGNCMIAAEFSTEAP